MQHRGISRHNERLQSSQKLFYSGDWQSTREDNAEVITSGVPLFPPPRRGSIRYGLEQCLQRGLLALLALGPTSFSTSKTYHISMNKESVSTALLVQ